MPYVVGGGVKVPGWGWLIEAPRPLSDSLLWELQRRFYTRRGPEAWTEDRVPSWATSNAWLGERLARLVIAWAEDARAAGAIDPSQPLYVVELAAGSGELGWHLLRYLEALAPPDLPQVQVVLTDFAAANLEAFAAHPGLARFRREGRLELATFDADRDTSLTLQNGVVLEPGAVRNPLLVLAAYLFDSLPQDAFWAAGGALFEGRAALTSSRRESDLEAPGVMHRLKLQYERRPITLPHYGEPDLDGVLRRYRDGLQAGAFGFPVAALRCLRRLVELASAGLGVLVLDKGTASLAELEGEPEPPVVVHGGCVSLLVDLFALGAWTKPQGGLACLPHGEHDVLRTAAYRFGAPRGWRATGRELDDLVDGFTPCDHYRVARSVPTTGPLTAEAFLTHLRRARYDPVLAERWWPRVIPPTSERLRVALADARARADAGAFRPL